jgi:HK97 family phage prohead protease
MQGAKMKHRINCNILELKLAQNDAATMEFTGYGAVFGNVDSYGDIIQKGAFSKYIEKVKSGLMQWPAMLLQHGGWGMSAQDTTPIGIWTDIAEDSNGLKVTGKLADTPRGKETYALMKMEPRPAISGLSIGYFAVETENGKKGDPYARLIKEIELLEISPVTFPANDKARIGDVKSINPRELEKILRDVGFSHNEAKIFLSKGLKAALGQREVDSKAEKDAIAAIFNQYY